MTVALLSIGTELLQGEIANSNAQWLGEQLTSLGFTVESIECVGDDRERLAEALERLRERHRFVIATGGLGPTSDDLTAEVAARVFGTVLAILFLGESFHAFHAAGFALILGGIVVASRSARASGS